MSNIGKNLFQLNRLPEITEETILQEIRRVADLIAEPIISGAEFLKHSNISMKPIRNRFGSWGNALRAAGLAHRWHGKIPQKGKSSTYSAKLSNDEIIHTMRGVAERLGKTEITIEDIEQYSDIGIGVLRRRFGSWRKALEASGLSQPKIGKRYADEECFENLLQVWTYYQRPPKYKEMGLPPSEVGGKAYVKRFGTWNKALAAFVERINSDLEGENDTPAVPKKKEATKIISSPLPEEERHEIKLGLRYKILLRDRFRCAICGNSPAIDNHCRLHVDHILPFSKGGKTEPGNLRALCEKCNIGKGSTIEQHNSSF